MWTLRLSLATTVMLMLLGGAGGVVLAQGDGAEEALVAPTAVTGRIIEGRQELPYSWDIAEGRVRFRGAVYVDPIEMDDARLSGTLWQTWSRDQLGSPDGTFPGTSGELIAGTSEIINDDGTWVGTLRGYILPQTSDYHFQIDLTGTGAYEGYSALLYADGPSTWEVEGFIFPGAFPDYPDPVVVLE